MRRLVMIGLLLCSGLASADWPRFRGPNGSGVAAGASTPAAFTAADFNWSVDLPGKGHSSPIVVGRRVFVTFGDPETARRSILCVNADTGQAMWRRDF